MPGFDKVSHSSFNDYLRCPALFYYRQFLKLKFPRKALPLAFGSALHKGLEEYEARGADPIEEFEKAFQFEKIYWEYKGKEMSEEDALVKYESEVENGIRLLEYFIDERENGSLSDYEVLHTEKKFKIPLTPIKKGQQCKVKLLSGIVDVVRTDGKLQDYKTSSKKYHQKDIEKSYQPTMYYLWYYLTYKKLPKGFIYTVFMKKRKGSPIDTLETHRTMDDLYKLIDNINLVKRKVDKKCFKRNHGKMGRGSYCDCFKLEAYFNSLREISYGRNRKR